MDTLKWEMLIEVNGRMEADLLVSYLEAGGVQVEVFQEAVGHLIYPVTIDGLGRVQLFVPSEQSALAHQLLEAYQKPKEESGRDP